MPNDRVLSFLGLARRAGAIEPGEDNVRAACRDKKAKLVILAGDASPNAEDRAASSAAASGTVLIKVPYTKDELAAALGTVGCSMIAVTDPGFAKETINKLAEVYPGRYDEAAAAAAKLSAAVTAKNKRRK